MPTWDELTPIPTQAAGPPRWENLTPAPAGPPSAMQETYQAAGGVGEPYTGGRRGAEGLRGVAREAPWAFPLAGSALALIPGLGPWLAATLGAVGGATGEAVREKVAEEPMQPGRIATTGAAAFAPPALGAGARGLGYAGARIFPGAGTALQRGGQKIVGGFLDALRKATPSAKPFWSSVAELGPETIPVPVLAQTVSEIAPKLQPAIEELRLSGGGGLAAAFEKLLTKRNSLTTEEIQVTLESMGDRIAAFQKSGATSSAVGALKKIYGALEDDLRAGADAGIPEAKTLLAARSATAKEKAYERLRDIFQTPNAPEEFGAVGTTAATGGELNIRPEKLLAELNDPRAPFTQNMIRQIGPDKFLQLKAMAKQLAEFPSVQGELPGFAQRLIPYGIMGGAGGLLGYQQGGFSGSLVGGATGLLAAEAGGLGLGAFAKTPAGQAMLRRMFLNKMGMGAGTRALTAVAPAFGQMLQSPAGP